MTARITISDTERRARVALRHRLVAPAAAVSVAEVTRSMVALHSSDPVTVYLSAVRRLAAPSVAAVDDALYHARSVVRHHAMRRTLWVVVPELAPAVHASSTLGLVGADQRRIAQWLVASGVGRDIGDAHRWISDGVAQLLAELEHRGEATTRELGDALPHLTAQLDVSPGKSYGSTISAHTRLLTLMGFMGSIVRTRPIGSWISGQYRWAPTAQWLGSGWPSLDPAAAQTAIVHEYLQAFGPATTADVQWWTGWTKGATTRALAAASAVAVETDGAGSAWVAADDMSTTGATTEAVEPWVALLPSLDPTTMGWKERGWFLPDDMARSLFDTNGNAGPTIWADGRVIGGWAQRADGTISTRLLTTIPRSRRRLLDAEIDRLHALLGPVRFRTRFPSPLSRELAG